MDKKYPADKFRWIKSNADSGVEEVRVWFQAERAGKTGS